MMNGVPAQGAVRAAVILWGAAAPTDRLAGNF